jgi:hypothetical protein
LDQGKKGRGRAYECRGEGDEGEDEGPAREDVAQGTDEQEAARVAGLHERGDRRGLFKGDVKGFGDAVEDGLVVVEVGDGEAGGLGSLMSMMCVEEGQGTMAHKTE